MQRNNIEWVFKRETEDCFCAVHESGTGQILVNSDSLQGLVSKIKQKEDEIYGFIPNKFTVLVQVV